MAPVNGDQWLRDFEKAKKTAQQIAREVEGSSGSKLDAKQAAMVRGNMATLRQEVSHLQQSLMAASQNTTAYNVTRKELSHRGDLLSQLSDNADSLQEAIKSGARRRIEASSGNAPWRDERYAPAESASNFCAEQELVNQDDSLDFLSGTVKNLKNMGGNITQEIDLHCRLLGELEDQTDNTKSKMAKQASQLARLGEEQSPVCYLWVCICIMIAILLVLLLVF